jgi:hypothetical protein
MKTKTIIKNFEKTNLQYDVEYDYERSACTCDAYERGDYCRCTTIERAWVESINVKLIVNKLYKKYCQEHSEINEYCFDRICSALRIYDKNLYEVETCGGYYGEEIDGVYFENEEELVSAYNELLKLESDIEKIKYCLNLEYGYLIDKVKNATLAYIHNIHTGLIKLPQQEYFMRLSREVLEGYRDRKLPVAVCIKNEDKYVLIDGYHRFIANKDKNINNIIVLE